MKQEARRTLRSLGLAGLAGLMAALGLVYATGGFTRNGPQAAAACPVDPARTARLQAAARGEVAAFVVERQPVPLPALAFQDGAGQAQTLAGVRDGRAALVNLWATWCVPCRHEMPALDRLEAALGGPDFRVVAISVDLGAADKPQAFYREVGLTRLGFHHDPTGRVFQVLRGAGRAVGMPATVLIDRQGCVLGHLNGPAEWASEDALALVRAGLVPRAGGPG